MKSLFSCFPKKRSKSKTTKKINNEPQLIVETKPILLNHCGDEVVKNHTSLNESYLCDEIKHVVKSENDKTELKVNEEEINRELEERLRNAISRIENVYYVLNNKKKMYNLPHAISDFQNLVDLELRTYVNQSDNLCGYFVHQASLIVTLFSLQYDLLNSLSNREFASINVINENFKSTIIELNKYCTRIDVNSELNRLIADSIMIFGWLCCFNNPSSFLQNVLDGCVMTAARWVNDTRYSKYSGWLKAWSTVLKVFSGIISRHFEAALMWRVDGPVPMDILQCLILCNYSNLPDEQPPVAVKPKVVKTTTVDLITYETVTSLFDDLRSGRQKSKLKSVKKDKPEDDDTLNNDPVPEQQVNETVDISSVVEEQDQRPYTFKNKTWTITHQTNNPDIEIPNKESNNSVVISSCNDCSIQIDGTITNIVIDNCSNINVILDEVSGLFSATDSSNLESQVLGTVKKVDLKRVSKFSLFIPKEECDKVVMVTCQCSDIDLYISNNEGGGLELTDYDRHTVGTSCRTVLHEGVASHTLL